jgi:NADPH:quinone reductase-like Zn-dependent oxidoreductase
VVVPTAVGIAQLPDAIDFETGATLGLAGTAAVQAVDAAALQAGETVVVAGATGGVGNQVLQLIRATGAISIATASSEAEVAQVRELGAACTVDYRGDAPAVVTSAKVGGVDAVIHLAGDAAAWLPAVANGGRLVSTMIMSPEQLPSDDVTVVPVYAVPSSETLDRIARNTVAGHTAVRVQQAFGLDEVPAALEVFRAGSMGKILITIG